MVEFITGASGSGKSTEMMKKIDTAAEHGREVCIIVPEQFSYEFDKTLYKKIGAKKFNMLLSLSFTGMARHIFQLYGDGRKNGRYADETSRMILIYQAIKALSENPQSKRYFEKQSSGAGFAEELLKLVGEMKKSGVTPQKLMEKSVLLEKRLMDKTDDVALIYLEFERLMSEYGFKDTFDDIKSAAAIANVNRYFKGKSVFIDEFESFTGDQTEMLRVIISSADDVCITLRTDDVNAGEFTLFETVNSTYRMLTGLCRELNKEYRTVSCREHYRFRSDDIAYLSENILRNKSIVPGSAPEAENIHIFEARDFYSEAEYVCAAIKRLICEDDTLKYSDIAIISNNIEEYAEVLESALERCSIPYFLSIEKPVMHTSVMIFISSLTEIITKQTYNSELIFRFIKCGLLEISLTDAAGLENYCYKWGIDGDVWKSSFTAPDEKLDELEAIRKSVIEPLEKLKAEVSGKCTAEKFCRLIYGYISECGAEKSVSRIMSRLIMENKDYSASEMKRLWSCMIDILDSISETLGETEITVSEAGRIIKSLTGRINYSVPPQKLDCVTAASARTARLNAPRVVFVMGANDGSFPNTVSLHGIFSESDKQKLAENGIEISRRLPEIIAAERLVVYKSLSASSEKLFITYPLSDLSGQSKYSAPIIDAIIKLFGRSNIRKTEHEIGPEFYAVTMKSAFYHYMQNRNRNSPAASAIRSILLEDIDYKRRLLYIQARSDKKQRHRVSSELMEQLRSFNPLIISPSSFELYNTCHFWYFCRECLKLFSREKVDLDARYSGSMIHSCFCRIISSRSKESFLRLSYEELEKEIAESASGYLSSEMGGEFAKTPRFELGFNKLSERLVKVFVHTQQELMASSFEPKAFEINLRDTDGEASLKLPFGDSKWLSFGGVIDRVDVCEVDGNSYVRIVDYKSSRKDIDACKLSNGINMQMLLYLFAITDDNGLFSKYSPAGVLYSPVTISQIDNADERDITENTSTINSSLKTSGLVLSERNVLEAMEHNIGGKYIPVKLSKEKLPDKHSSCITTEAFSELKDFSYKKLTEMADEVYSGNADANPLIFAGQSAPCEFCDYSNVCGNKPLSRYRDAGRTDTEEAEKILAKKTGEDNENAVD